MHQAEFVVEKERLAKERKIAAAEVEAAAAAGGAAAATAAVKEVYDRPEVALKAAASVAVHCCGRKSAQCGLVAAAAQRPRAGAKVRRAVPTPSERKTKGEARGGFPGHRCRPMA